MWPLPATQHACPSVKFVNLLPGIQLSMLKYYSRSPIYLIFFFSIQQVTWTIQILFDALFGHFPFEKKFKKRCSADYFQELYVYVFLGVKALRVDFLSVASVVPSI
jgi:hypothetical protein